MKKKILLITFIFAFMISLTSFAQAQVTINEFYNPTTNTGWYDIIVQDAEIVAFAVGTDNFDPVDPDTWISDPSAIPEFFEDAASWGTDPINPGDWNLAAAIANNLNGWNVPDFSTAFPGFTLANVYYDRGMNPITGGTTPNRSISNESVTNTFYFEGNPNSNWIAIDADKQTTYAGLNETVIVPEPISSTLFIVGGATLGFRRFRKKRITA